VLSVIRRRWSQGRSFNAGHTTTALIGAPGNARPQGGTALLTPGSGGGIAFPVHADVSATDYTSPVSTDVTAAAAAGAGGDSRRHYHLNSSSSSSPAGAAQPLCQPGNDDSADDHENLRDFGLPSYHECFQTQPAALHGAATQ